MMIEDLSSLNTSVDEKGKTIYTYVASDASFYTAQYIQLVCDDEYTFKCLIDILKKLGYKNTPRQGEWVEKTVNFYIQGNSILRFFHESDKKGIKEINEIFILNSAVFTVDPIDFIQYYEDIEHEIEQYDMSKHYGRLWI